MSVSEPGKIITPWAESGLKNPIPPAADPATGRAGFDQGFSAINMTAKEAGGIPPFGQDFNGIFFSITEILRYMQAGGLPTYSAAMSTAIGGYPLGAMLLKASGLGLWRNAVANNTSNPDTGGAGWISDAVGNYAGATVITASSTSLTAAQAGQAFLFSTASSTCTFPTSSSVPAGSCYRIETSAGVTLSVTGGASMQVGNASVTSFYLPAGTDALVISAGTTWWVFGSGTLSKSASFAASLSSSGYQYLPSGMIIQFGTVPAGESANFPIPFPNACFSVGVSYYNSSGASSPTWAQMKVTTTNTSISGHPLADQFRYIAIGW